MLVELFNVDIPCEHDSDNRIEIVSVGVYSDRPHLLDVCTPSGGVRISVEEARKLIATLEQAIAFVERENT